MVFAAYTILVQLYWCYWVNRRFYLLRVSQVVLCGRMLINLTILNLGVSLLFFKHSMSLPSIYHVVLSPHPWVGLAATKVGTFLKFSSLFMILLIFAHLKSSVLYFPLLNPLRLFSTLNSHYSSSVPACFGEAVKELKACGVSKKCGTAAVKYCYKS